MPGHLVGKADARRKVDLVAVVDVLWRAWAPAGHHQTGGAVGVEDGEIRRVGVEGLLVVVTQAEADVQLRRELPGVLRKSGSGVGVDEALLGAKGDAGRIRVAGKEVSQIQDVGVGDRGIACPWPEYAWPVPKLKAPRPPQL